MASLCVNTFSVVHEFVCYITRDIMVDPVIAEDGHSYERSAIERWYEEHTTSPLTSENIDTNLFPNHNLRKIIQDWQVAKQKFEIDIDGELCGQLFNAILKTFLVYLPMMIIRANASIFSIIINGLSLLMVVSILVSSDSRFSKLIRAICRWRFDGALRN